MHERTQRFHREEPNLERMTERQLLAWLHADAQYRAWTIRMQIGGTMQRFAEAA